MPLNKGLTFVYLAGRTLGRDQTPIMTGKENNKEGSNNERQKKYNIRIDLTLKRSMHTGTA